jgi:hypothetical protein
MLSISTARRHILQDLEDKQHIIPPMRVLFPLSNCGNCAVFSSVGHFIHCYSYNRLLGFVDFVQYWFLVDLDRFKEVSLSWMKN